MTDKLRDHTFDGIQEFDNKLPNWWLFILYGSIVFSLGYWLVFHTFKIIDLPVAKYNTEMAAIADAQLAAAMEGGITNESLLMMADMPESITEGKALFDQYCVVCHLEKGQGLVGPNLTDNYWIHGAEPINIHHIVTNGVLDKGMVAWGAQLGPKRVNKIVSYVLTIKNTNVVGKAPEGEQVPE
ncbi:MAG: c-type cytochrome [bacterium]|nr:c-type cytochrome [bacterium]